MDAVTPSATAPETTPQAPPEPSTSISLREMRAKRDTPEPAKPAEKAAPEPEDDEPEDVAGEIDKIEAPKPEETPAERRARRDRHRKAAAKGVTTRFRQERDEARARLAALERELTARPRAAEAPPSQPSAGASASADRPKPTLRDFPLEKFASEDDPYQAQSAALAEAISEWKWEQKDAESRTARQREAAEREAQEVQRAHGDRITEARGRYKDFDAVVNGASFPATPASQDLREMVERSPLSGDLVYYLSSHPDETIGLLHSPSRTALIEGLAEIKATVKAALKAEKPAPPKVTGSPEPVQPVTAGGPSGGLLRNPLKDTGSRVSLREIRAYREASGR